MTHTPARIVAQLLVDLGVAGAVGGTGSWPVYVGPTPDGPDNAMVVRGTTGADESDLLTTGSPDFRYGVQIMVRARTEPDAELKCYAVAAALRPVLTRVVRVSGTPYLVDAVTGAGPPLRVGEETEASKRILYSLNPMLTVRQLAPGS